MEKLGFSSLRSLNQLRSTIAPSKSYQMPSRPSSDSLSMGSFANLKLTAEKLVKEQASVKTDLEMANSKLKKSTEHIHVLEEKLQNAVNDNAKLSVKQKEDAKLWKGLESKFSSTKALCDQLTETLQQLSSQVRDAEQDKKAFEDKLSASSNSFDSLQLQFSGLSLKVQSTEENMRKCEQQLMELRIEKEEKEKIYTDEHNRACNLIEEKDSSIKSLEATIAAEKLRQESLTSRLEDLQHELCSKEEICLQLRLTQENLEKEKHTLQCSNDDYAKSLLESEQEIKSLEQSVRCLMEKFVELDKHSLVVSHHVTQLNSAFDTCYTLFQQEKDLTLKLAHRQFDQLHDRFLHVTSENAEFRSEIEDLKEQTINLQKEHGNLMIQHTEECRLTEEKIQSLHSEASTLVSKKTALELQVAKLEKSIEQLSETSTLSENKVQDLMVKISELELENHDIQDQLQAKLQGKSEEIEALQKEIARQEQAIDSMEKQAIQLRDNLDEKEHIHQQFKDRERQLEEQKTEIQASLAVAESTLAEAKKQYDLMLESKQMELTKHINDISQKNDQAINAIRRKFELEKLEIINLEKEKAEKLVGEMEMKCEQKLEESKKESKENLIHVQEEHASLINRLQQELDKKVSDLRADHSEELRHVRLEAEELREKTMLLKKEHEGQIRALKCQHEDEYQKLQEELKLQKSKEETQRALLQLQWKVMDGNPQEDQEVNSKKEHSVSSIKMYDNEGRNRKPPTMRRPHHAGKVSKRTTSPFLRAAQTPVSNILKKVEKVDPGGVMTMPKHSRKVTHHEYEVETSDGNTITKRRKTKSTVMFTDPTKRKRTTTPRARVSKETAKVKEVAPSRPSNIGDLFSEGSLNPYADDPYAFD